MSNTTQTEFFSKHPLYRTYYDMVRRCTNPKSSIYYKYGARGITVCEEWLGEQGFWKFVEHLGDKPSSKHTIDRIDGKLGYFPGNCRWATYEEQNNNLSTNRNLTYKGVCKPLATWARELGIARTTLYDRLTKLNMSVDEAFTKPIRGRR